MQWLVSGAQPNDSLFFHCENQLADAHKSIELIAALTTDSGHGSQQRDTDGDEEDG